MKTISDMTASELREVWMNGRTAVERSAALREYERRKAAEPMRIRAEIERVIDRLGIVETLSAISEICGERAKSIDPAEAFAWSIRMEAIRQAAEESEAEVA